MITLNAPAINRIILAACLTAAAFLSGCATVTRGTKEELTVQSTPSGAHVRLSTGQTGVTPATFTIPRKGDLSVTVSMDGYETQEVFLSSKLSGAGTAGFLGNALIGGVIGGGIDVISGATLSHTPNPVIVSLVAKTRASVASAAPPDNTAQALPTPAEPEPPADASPTPTSEATPTAPSPGNG